MVAKNNAANTQGPLPPVAVRMTARDYQKTNNHNIAPFVVPMIVKMKAMSSAKKAYVPLLPVTVMMTARNNRRCVPKNAYPAAAPWQEVAPKRKTHQPNKSVTKVKFQ